MLRRIAVRDENGTWFTGRVPTALQIVVVWGERFIAVVLFVAVVAFAVGVIREARGADWTAPDTLYQIIRHALLLGVGLELVRLLVTHDLVAVLELMAFVLARKILQPELAASEILLIVLAFVTLIAARRYLLPATPAKHPAPAAAPPS